MSQVCLVSQSHPPSSQRKLTQNTFGPAQEGGCGSLSHPTFFPSFSLFSDKWARMDYSLTCLLFNNCQNCLKKKGLLWWDEEVDFLYLGKTLQQDLETWWECYRRIRPHMGGCHFSTALASPLTVILQLRTIGLYILLGAFAPAV